MYGEQSSLDEARPTLIGRALRALRPRQGWEVLVLAWGAAISLPAAAVSSGLIAGIGPIPWLATLALLLAWWLAGRRISGPAAAGVLGLSGLAADLIWGVRVVRFGPLATQALRWLAWLAGERGVPAPAITYFHEQGAALATFGQRAVWWTSSLVRGQGVPDNLVVIGLAGLLAWALAAWAGWWVARRGQTFLGLLPTGIVLAQVAYWAEDVRWALLIFLGGLTLLLVLARMAWLVAGWEREGVDYSPEIRLDAVMVAAALTCVVMFLAPTVPFLTSAQASQAFWRLFESPYREIEERVGASFAGVQPARSLVPPAGVAPGGMPRSHLLGGRPELGEEIALRVRPRGAGLDATPYWRGQTFARYTGQGWDESEADVTELRLAAGQPWNPGAAAAGRPLVSAVEVVAGSRAVLYAAAEPVAVDRPYRAKVRAAGELVALAADDSPARYTVLSQSVAADAVQLRQAGEDYPPEVLKGYLQLPDGLDPRLAALASEWTAGASTPYDRATAIETALRLLPYTLEVPSPPAGREVVSWFLFDLGEGYCDYFASAMVVLSRLNGIPARLAVGYAAGSYDAGSDEVTITELDAHSWPELYFAGYGWIGFEPTPAQPLPARLEADPAGAGLAGGGYSGGPGDLEAGMAELRVLAEGNAAADRLRLTLGYAAAALNGLLMVSWLVGWRLGRRSRWVRVDVPQEASVGFQRLERWGARLGRSAAIGETPREYAGAVASKASAIASAARWRQARAAAAARVIHIDTERLVESYERAVFAPQEAVVRQPWPRLWAAFRQVWLARWPRGRRPPRR